MRKAEKISPRPSAIVHKEPTKAHKQELVRHVVNENPVKEPSTMVHTPRKTLDIQLVTDKKTRPGVETAYNELLEHNRKLEADLLKLSAINKELSNDKKGSLERKEKMVQLNKHVELLMVQNKDLNLALKALKEEMDLIAFSKISMAISERIDYTDYQRRADEHIVFFEQQLREKDVMISNLTAAIESLSARMVSIDDYKRLQEQQNESARTIMRLEKELISLRRNPPSREILHLGPESKGNKYELLLEKKNRKIQALQEEGGKLKEENLKLKNDPTNPRYTQNYSVVGYKEQPNIFENVEIRQTRNHNLGLNRDQDYFAVDQTHENLNTVIQIPYNPSENHHAIPQTSVHRTDHRFSVNRDFEPHPNRIVTYSERRMTDSPEEAEEYSMATGDRVLIEEGSYANIRFKRYHSPAVSYKTPVPIGLKQRDYSIGNLRATSSTERDSPNAREQLSRNSLQVNAFIPGSQFLDKLNHISNDRDTTIKQYYIPATLEGNVARVVQKETLGARQYTQPRTLVDQGVVRGEARGFRVENDFKPAHLRTEA